MSKLLVIVIIGIYLVVMFLIATYAERLKRKQKQFLPPVLTYSLSLAVFCTAWTFFGSIGNAASTGIGFMPVYLGPTIFMPIIGIVLVKMIRICNSQRITSIADFISSRYGKNISLGIIVSVFCIIGIIPYIAIQLKAISASVNLLTGYYNQDHTWWADSTLYVALGLIFFVLIYGIKHLDTTEKHTGVISAIAFESVVKLIAFLVIGIFVCYGLYNGVGDIFQQSFRIEKLKNHFVFNSDVTPLSWFLVAFVSALAILLLPRQFQVAVVENTDERHVKKALWIFPLYLLFINFFVLPIAFAGLLNFKAPIDYDFLLLHFPLQFEQKTLAIVVFLGGFSAATGMVIVEVIALTTMISNNLTMPLLLSFRSFRHQSGHWGKSVLLSRRVGVFILIGLAYFFEKQVAEKYSLVSIGMISFVAVAQFAPAVILGMYWKQANRKAALSSIVVGFMVWFYTLVLPSLADQFIWIKECVQNGPGSISLLKPHALLGLQGLDPVSHGIFWSLLINLFVFVSISYYAKAGVAEQHQAILFVDHDKAQAQVMSRIFKGYILYADIQQLLKDFIGKQRADILLEGYANRHGILNNQQKEADPRMVSFTERILGGVIGAASSRLMISSITTNEQLSLTEVLDIVKESQQFIELNKELRKKSQELEKASKELGEANKQLKLMDELKNEFLYTVTHEIRTPLTSIRALSEILYDHGDMDEDQRQTYLDIIIRETEKLTHLITQVLNLEKYESGKQKLKPVSFDLVNLSNEVVKSLKALSMEKNLNVEIQVPNSSLIIHADLDLIRQVIYNLLSNAIKFAETRIEIRFIPGLVDIEFRLQDDGPGVEEDTKELLFDKFYQSGHHLHKQAGSGLGLSICKKIIELHHGKIGVENNKGKGACFNFVIPIIYQ